MDTDALIGKVIRRANVVDPPHSGNFGAGIAEKFKAVGIEHEINCNNDYGK